MEREMLESRWESFDRPVLVQLARQLEETQRTLTTGDPEILRSVIALTPTYLNATVQRTGDSRPYVAIIRGLTERGRREVGLWPDDEPAAEALIDLLAKAADTVDDADDASTLRKAGRLLKSVPSAVLADVAAALIRQQTGLS